MENWKKVWRDGFVPSIPRDALLSLKEALEKDDPRLLQGATTSPPPLECVRDWPVEAACLIGFCGTHVHGSFGEATVSQVEEWFAQRCFEADQRLGEPAACRWFLNWADDTPRQEMRQEMIAELRQNLEALS